MLVSLLLTVVFTVGGAVMFGAMYTRHDTYYGALGLMSLCVAGMTGAAYGVLHSAA